MSEFFSGVTFAEQSVTPSDDAIVRRAALPDGILTGCALSYSGSMLTMGAGALLICGRLVRHTAAQSWSVVGANSGYARLVLTVDLSRTATKDAFDQVVDSVEYAATLDGFAALTQTDINATGTMYQIVVCTVSLGSTGITGIIPTGKQQTFPSLAALDTLTAAGNYRLDVPANDALISGVNFSKASVSVEAYDDSLAHQTLTAIRSGVRVMRSSTSGVYGPWSFINPPMTPGVEFRTTEKFNDKPVYTKLLAIDGTSFSSNIISVPHSIEGLDVCFSTDVAWKRTESTEGGWAQLPIADPDSSAKNGHVSYVGDTTITFFTGSTLRSRLYKSTEPVYVTLKYTKA